LVTPTIRYPLSR